MDSRCHHNPSSLLLWGGHTPDLPDNHTTNPLKRPESMTELPASPVGCGIHQQRTKQYSDPSATVKGGNAQAMTNTNLSFSGSCSPSAITAATTKKLFVLAFRDTHFNHSSESHYLFSLSSFLFPPRLLVCSPKGPSDRILLASHEY